MTAKKTKPAALAAAPAASMPVPAPAHAPVPAPVPAPAPAMSPPVARAAPPTTPKAAPAGKEEEKRRTTISDVLVALAYPKDATPQERLETLATLKPSRDVLRGALSRLEAVKGPTALLHEYAEQAGVEVHDLRFGRSRVSVGETRSYRVQQFENSYFVRLPMDAWPVGKGDKVIATFNENDITLTLP